MASPNEPTPGSALPEQTVEPDLPLDTITLHVLSPSPEISGGRVTFPSIPLDTKISRLKSRIQNSMSGPAPPERQRLIYRGRPLLNMESTLRDILRSEVRFNRVSKVKY
jgi:Ubiquitin family